MPTSQTPDAIMLRKLGRAVLGNLDHGWKRTIARLIGMPESTFSDVSRGYRELNETHRRVVVRLLEENT